MHLCLREIRQRLGLSQAEVAVRAGCTRAAISHWECGRSWPPMEMIPLLAQALGVPNALLLCLASDGGSCAHPGLEAS